MTVTAQPRLASQDCHQNKTSQQRKAIPPEICRSLLYRPNLYWVIFCCVCSTARPDTVYSLSGLVLAAGLARMCGSLPVTGDPPSPSRTSLQCRHQRSGTQRGLLFNVGIKAKINTMSPQQIIIPAAVIVGCLPATRWGRELLVLLSILYSF